MLGALWWDWLFPPTGLDRGLEGSYACCKGCAGGDCWTAGVLADPTGKESVSSGKARGGSALGPCSRCRSVDSGTCASLGALPASQGCCRPVEAPLEVIWPGDGPTVGWALHGCDLQGGVEAAGGGGCLPCLLLSSGPDWPHSAGFHPVTRCGPCMTGRHPGGPERHSGRIPRRG